MYDPLKIFIYDPLKIFIYDPLKIKILFDLETVSQPIEICMLKPYCKKNRLIFQIIEKN